jgi:hypothetical protein
MIPRPTEHCHGDKPPDKQIVHGVLNCPPLNMAVDPTFYNIYLKKLDSNVQTYARVGASELDIWHFLNWQSASFEEISSRIYTATDSISMSIFHNRGAASLPQHNISIKETIRAQNLAKKYHSLTMKI